tara:strand:+ start:2516 stop:3415 length:900 start_codon:yes stop_codon:yes gene_type:complete
MRVLSLFDGIGCGQVALNSLGIYPEVCYASEIDGYALRVSKRHFPNTIHLGDISTVKAHDVGDIDLLMGGSPCQSFSKSYSQSDRGFEGSSKLLWEYVRLFREVKPRYFLLENVIMRKEYVDLISKELGVRPIKINSSLFTGGQRNRLYWTNIPQTALPSTGSFQLSDYIDITHDGHRLSSLIQERYQTLEDADHKLIGHHSIIGTTAPSFRTVGQRDYVYGLHEGSLMGCLLASDYKQPKQIMLPSGEIRKITPTECERLMGLPLGYSAELSDSQRYKAIGNGWQIDTIAHLLKYLSL